MTITAPSVATTAPALDRPQAAWSRPVSGPAPGRPDPAACRMLELLGAGLKDEAIARSLGVSSRTVRRRVAELEDRFGAANRIQLVARAAVHGWVRV